MRTARAGLRGSEMRRLRSSTVKSADATVTPMLLLVIGLPPLLPRVTMAVVVVAVVTVAIAMAVAMALTRHRLCWHRMIRHLPSKLLVLRPVRKIEAPIGSVRGLLTSRHHLTRLLKGMRLPLVAVLLAVQRLLPANHSCADLLALAH